MTNKTKQIKILFICHGNICRSPMAEFIMNHIADNAGRSHQIISHSAATSTEEIGNDIHRGTRSVLLRHNIPFRSRRARQVTADDYSSYDYLIVMDDNNLRNLKRIIPSDPDHKIRKLLSFTANPHNIADPWYTDDFDTAYTEITEGCEKLLQFILERQENVPHGTF